MKKISKIVILFFLDAILINFSYVIALLLRFEFDMYSNGFQGYLDIYLNNFVAITLIKIVILYLFAMYKSIWRYASIDEIVKTVAASFISAATVVFYFTIINDALPRSIYVLTLIFDICFIGGIRLSYRFLRQMAGKKDIILKSHITKNIMIIGAGDAGASIIKEMKSHGELHSIPKIAIDDDKAKINKSISGVPIIGGTENIINAVGKYKIDEIIIAIPSANKKKIAELVEIASKTGCKLKILPALFELIDGKVSVSKLRNVDIEDLLGRDEVKVDLGEISAYLNNKVVLVTGGGGSIGSELCRQIAKYKPKKLIAFDIYENSVFEIQSEMKWENKDIDFEAMIGSVRDEERLEEIFEKYNIDTVFHAAAHKHVPLMEADPKEAVKNNILGTSNLLNFANKYEIERFVLISTDKAVNPTNVMGATKRAAEMLMQIKSRNSKTIFSAVRFGNVLGSNGSVIPTFRKQIEDGGPVTVTHAEVTRYFMTIPEATQLVIQAGAMANGGEIFILDMGEPVRIIDLAENLIRLSGYIPYEDIEIEITGLRPGEKLYEELLMDEEGIKETIHEKIYIGKPMELDEEKILENINELKIGLNNSNGFTKEMLQKIVTTYTPGK